MDCGRKGSDTVIGRGRKAAVEQIVWEREDDLREENPWDLADGRFEPCRPLLQNRRKQIL